MLGNFVVVMAAIAKHDDQNDEGENNYEQKGDDDCHHPDTWFFGRRFVDFGLNVRHKSELDSSEIQTTQFHIINYKMYQEI